METTILWGLSRVYIGVNLGLNFGGLSGMRFWGSKRGGSCASGLKDAVADMFCVLWCFFVSITSISITMIISIMKNVYYDYSYHLTIQ